MEVIFIAMSSELVFAKVEVIAMVALVSKKLDHLDLK